MDWNKAKTILIIGFILIDAFLFTQVYDLGSSLERESESTVFQVLNDYGIEIEATIPSEYIYLPLLEVEYRIYDGESFELSKYLGAEYSEIRMDEHYRNTKGASIQIIDGKKLVFQLRKTEVDNDLNMEDAISYVDKFIEEYEMDLDDYGEMNIILKNGVFNITYYKIFGEYSLENAYIKFIVDGRGVAGFEEQNINSVKKSQGTVKVTKAEEALLRLLRYGDISNHILREVKICYYDDELGEDWKNIVRDTVDPTWKAVFDGGIIKYLTETE